MTGLLIDNLTDMKQHSKKCIALYSGGLDSTFFLHWAKQHDLEVVALNINLQQDPPRDTIENIAKRIGVNYHYIDAIHEFADEYISLGIKANSLYQNSFPICSSLSRPLMAKKAVELAFQENADCIVHTTCYHQNSASRFNLSIRSLAPGMNIGNPFLKESLSREQKYHELNGLNLLHTSSIYSVDENIWGRVIENGALDDLHNLVPEEVFKWTVNSQYSPKKNHDLTITFESGLPIAIDGQSKNLADIIAILTDIGKLYGIGRYNGLEDTPLGLKNHEVREAPAAAVLLKASQALSRATLTQKELRIKSFLDYEWTELVVGGGWFSSLKIALDAFMELISKNVSGEIVLTYTPGDIFISSIRSPKSLDFHSFGRDLEEHLLKFSYREFFELSASHLYNRAQ
jgi:argininosuccinate synthase